MRGHLIGLLQEKRVSLAMAQDALAETRAFLSGSGAPIPDTDERLQPLVRHIESELKRVTPAKGTQREPRRIGQTVRYTAQTNPKRKAKYVHTPLSTLELDGQKLEQIDMTFVGDQPITVTNCIVIKRAP